MDHPNPDFIAADSADPCGYVCYYIDRPIEVTGNGEDPAWSEAAWTDDFIDIQGPEDTSDQPTPRYRTRVKMRYCEDYLYILAEMEEPQVCATITEKNAVIFHDNDFEVFIDPDGDNHNYYEFEGNALGTIWELSLPKPYRTGAQPISPDNMDGLVYKVRVHGTLNDPTREDTGWTVEMAIPFAGMAKYIDEASGLTRADRPGHGEQWRLNFSRVQWRWAVRDGMYVKDPPRQAEDNWVWTSQGVIDMHRPAVWGYLQFSEAAPGEDVLVPDPTLRGRNALMGIWERMRAADHQPQSLTELFEQTAPLPADAPAVDLTHDEAHGWIATTTIETPDGDVVLAVRRDAKLWAKGSVPSSH